MASCGADDGVPGGAASDTPGAVTRQPVSLPEPRMRGPASLEEVLARRRSVRDFGDEALSAAQLAQLLWAAQGVTASGEGLRTAPSAGALYPLELYVAVEHVSGVPTGVYHYRPKEHRLDPILGHSVRDRLCRDALSQSAVADAPATIALAAVFERTTRKYGDRGRRYVHIEAGHAAENVYLQAAALGLGTVAIGAFHDDRVKATLGMRRDEEPLYLMPVGVLP